MRKSIVAMLGIALGYSGFLAAQGPDWTQMAETYRLREETGLPAYIRIREDFRPGVESSDALLRGVLSMGAQDQWVLSTSERDPLGMTHYRYAQQFAGVPVEFAHYYVHTRQGKIVSVNGHFIPVNTATAPLITRDAARDAAMQALGGKVWMWQLQDEEAWLKMVNHDSQASYFPQGDLVIAPKNTEFLGKDYRLAWKFDLYSKEPLLREDVYVDAQSGEVLFRNPQLFHADSVGTAVTKYSGTQTMTADFTGSNFRLRETGRGGGIETYNMNRGTNYFGATDFLDSDNYWDNVNAFADEAATDGHWGAEMTWDYYMIRYGRNSFDNNGATMRSYIHFDQNYENAFWDGQRMTYGDGGNGNRPFCSLDVCGHEFSHGVVEYTANLVYQDEPGGLNESYADIFGTSIEFYARPSSANWLIGENLGTFRSMSDPKQYSNPDTYQGSFWISAGGFDNGGVHINSGVQNHWFYLLSVGGSGTNDNGDSYSVTGIGIDSAAAIAYRCLSVYLGPTSQFEDATLYSIESAKDLFGSCSPKMIATMNAWYAVGLGRPFGTLSADFEIDEDAHCTAPATVEFTNLSVGGLNYRWEFGDGTYSTDLNPTHQYSFFGSYTPRLIVEGCTGNDTFILPNPIVINSALPCTSVMPQQGNTVQTACSGRLLDSGGNGNYLPNTNSSLTITVPSGVVELVFSSFDYVQGGDYVAIYDGANASAPQIGIYNGTALPNGGTITSTGNSLTIVERSNAVTERTGFEAMWNCLVAVDGAEFAPTLNVYPNPTQGILHIELPTGPNSVLILCNAFGRTVRQQMVNGQAQRLQWDVNDLANGVYFLQWNGTTQKVVVSK